MQSNRGGTLNQAQRLQAFFEAYDADDDGLLSRKELEELFVSLKLAVTSAQLDDIYAQLNLSPAQSIDLTNFSRIYIRVKRIALSTTPEPAGRGTGEPNFASLPHVALTSSTFLESHQQQQQQSMQYNQQVIFGQQQPSLLGASMSTPNFMSASEGIPLQNLNSNIRKSAVISPDEVIENVPRQLTEGGDSEANSRQELMKSKIVKTYDSNESDRADAPSAPLDVDTIEDYYFYSDDEGADDEEEEKENAPFRRRALSGIKESSDNLGGVDDAIKTSSEHKQLGTVAEESPEKASRVSGRRHYKFTKADRRASDGSLLIQEKHESRKRVQDKITESPKSRQGRRYQQVGMSPNAAGYVALKDPYVRKQLKTLYYSEVIIYSYSYAYSILIGCLDSPISFVCYFSSRLATSRF